MRETVSEFLSKLKMNKKHNIRLLTILMILSVIVSLNVFFALRKPGVTMAGDADCKIEEHIHTEECFEKRIICENIDSSHVHLEECSENILTCSKTEHTHSVSCYSDITADTETQLDWQKMLSEVDYKENLKENLVKVAKTQLGYSESIKNFQVDENGNRRGYTRYGEWFGSPYSDWSAMFVSFCLHYAGSDTSQTPYNLGSEAMRLAWNDKNILKDTNLYDVQAGDVIFLDDNGDEKADRVGIVTHITDLYVNVIEGDVDGSVKENACKKSDEKIIAYGATPEKINTLSESVYAPVYLATGQVAGLTQNTIKNAFVTDPKYVGMYNADNPLGISGSFHIVALDRADLKAHTNGNVLAKNLYATSNFGTSSKNGVDLIELSYAQNYKQITSTSGADTTDYLVIGSSNTVTSVDNGNAFAINGTKIDKPKKTNIIQDANSETAPFIDFVYLENEIKSISSQLASYKNSDSSILKVNTTGSNLYLEITNKDYVGIYTFTAQEIVDFSSNNGELKMQGFGTGGNGAIIVNVDCADWDESKILTLPQSYVYVDGKQVGLEETLDFSAGKVIWNFINAARASGELIEIRTHLMSGALIAPDSHINMTQNYNGTAIGRHVEINAETHRTDYIGKIIPTGEIGGAYIDVYKVDENDSEVKLSDAEYTLYEWNGSDWQISTQNNQNIIKLTNIDGAAYFKGLAYNVAYMLKETKAPNGYVLDETPFYFYFSSTNIESNPIKMPNDFENMANKNCYSHTFTNECLISNEYASLSINKNWLNASNVAEIPSNVTSASFELWRVSRNDTTSEWANAERIYENIIVGENNNWSWQAGENELLASKTVGTNTTYYAYYVIETSSVDGYAPSYNGITQESPQAGNFDWKISVTNHKVETTSLNITKKWFDIDGAIMTEPPVDNILIQLYVSEDNGNTWSKYASPMEISRANNWKLTVMNLPRKNPETNATYTYKVSELEIENFSAKIEKDSEGNIIIKNTCTKEFTSIKVDKKWIRNGKYVNKATGSVDVELYQIAGFGGGTSTAPAGDNVAVNIQVGQYYYGNAQYQNKIYEVPVGTKMTIVYDFIPAGDGYYLNEVVNGVSTALTPVSKIENGASSNGNKGYNVTYEYTVTCSASLQGILGTWITDYSHKVTVTYEEPATMTTTLYKTATINSETDWTYTFGNLPKYMLDANGNPTENKYYYYVLETNSEEYSPVYKDLLGNSVNEENPLTEGTIVIENTVVGNAYELPATGGEGVLPYILIGALLIACPICIVYINYKNKRGRKQN